MEGRGGKGREEEGKGGMGGKGGTGLVLAGAEGAPLRPTHSPASPPGPQTCSRVGLTSQTNGLSQPVCSLPTSQQTRDYLILPFLCVTF